MPEVVMYCKMQYRVVQRRRIRRRDMAAGTKKKEPPLSMRLPAADIAMIDRAADLRGRSRTDFVREAAVRAGEEIVLESALVRMSPRGFAAFMAATEAPATEVPELVTVLKRKAPWEIGRRK